MNTLLRKAQLLPVAIAAAVTMMVAAPAAQAQWAVVDVPQTIQVILSETMRAADAAKSYAVDAQQLNYELRQWQDMVANSTGLSQSEWASVARDIQKLQRNYENVKSLAADAANTDGMFKSRYKGYDALLQQSGQTQTLQQQLKAWADEGYDNARATMGVNGSQLSMMADEDAVMRRLIDQSQSAEGRQQALQIANQIAAQQVQQTQKLRQLLIAQTQMQANALAATTDRTAAQDAATQKFMSVPLKDTPGKAF